MVDGRASRKGTQRNAKELAARPGRRARGRGGIGRGFGSLWVGVSLAALSAAGGFCPAELWRVFRYSIVKVRMRLVDAYLLYCTTRWEGSGGGRSNGVVE